MSGEIEKKEIITVAGHLGSGKSTLAKGAAAELGFKHYSTGDLFRELSAQRGLDLMGGNVVAQRDTSLDEAVDARTRQLGETEDRFVMDSRIAWHWIPGSYKVYLTLDPLIAATRILSNMTPERMATEAIPSDPMKYADVLEERRAIEGQRYRALYGIDPSDYDNYDIVIDSALSDPNVVRSLVIRGFRRHTSLAPFSTH